GDNLLSLLLLLGLQLVTQGHELVDLFGDAFLLGEGWDCYLKPSKYPLVQVAHGRTHSPARKPQSNARRAEPEGEVLGQQLRRRTKKHGPRATEPTVLMVTHDSRSSHLSSTAQNHIAGANTVEFKSFKGSIRYSLGRVRDDVAVHNVDRID